MVAALFKSAAVMGSTAVIATGCVPLPHTHTRQPAIDFTITDSLGTPLPAAKFSLYSAFIVGQNATTRLDVVADSTGHGIVPHRREWHWFLVLVPDGEAPWVWAWCAEAPGFATSRGRLQNSRAATLRIVMMRAAAPEACPEPPVSLYQVAPESALPSGAHGHSSVRSRPPDTGPEVSMPAATAAMRRPSNTRLKQPGARGMGL